MLDMLTPFIESAFLFMAGMVAGALNAVAGGGTFFAFPALLLTGAMPVAANATCTIAVWPASLASVYAFRHYMGEHLRRLPWAIALAIIGGWAGAQLLLLTPDATFSWMIPWLLLTATILFAYGKTASAWLARLTAHLSEARSIRIVLATLLLCITSLYGGFFGAGLGILTLATLQVLGIEENMHRLNALKTVVAASVNAAAFFTFALSDIVLWDHAFVMMMGGLIGGYGGARLSLRVSPQYVRRFVLMVASLATVYFFVKVYFSQ